MNYDFSFSSEYTLVILIGYSYIALVLSCEFLFVLIFFVLNYNLVLSVFDDWLRNFFQVFFSLCDIIYDSVLCHLWIFFVRFLFWRPMRSTFLITWLTISQDQWILICNLILSKLSGNFDAGLYFALYFRFLSSIFPCLMPLFVIFLSSCYKNFDSVLPLLEVLRYISVVGSPGSIAFLVI